VLKNKNNFEIINLFFIVRPRTFQSTLVCNRLCLPIDVSNCPCLHHDVSNRLCLPNDVSNRPCLHRDVSNRLSVRNKSDVTSDY
jgi:hypothetical protein